jgi:hypothetical protein
MKTIFVGPQGIRAGFSIMGPSGLQVARRAPKQVPWSFLSLSFCFWLLHGPIRGSKPSPWHQIRSYPALLSRKAAKVEVTSFAAD